MPQCWISDVEWTPGGERHGGRTELTMRRVRSQESSGRRQELGNIAAQGAISGFVRAVVSWLIERVFGQ